MTYAECSQALRGLENFLLNHPDMNQHPTHAYISKTGVSGVLITVDIISVQGQSQIIDMDSGLQFKGRLLSNRIMPTEDLHGILRSVKDEMDGGGSAAVSIPWWKTWNDGSLTSTMAMLNPVPAGVNIPWTTMANLIGAVEALYNIPGAKLGVLTGDIWITSPAPFSYIIGVFNILLGSHEFPPFPTLGETETGTLIEQ